MISHPAPSDHLRERREALGLSRADLAARSGVSAGSIGAWESNARTPQSGTWQRVMAALAAYDEESPAASHAAPPGAAVTPVPAPVIHSASPGATVRRRSRPYTAAEERRIRAAVGAGRDLGALARSLGRPASSVRRRAAAMGLIETAPRARQPLDPSIRQAIIERYAAGEGRTAIARAIERSVHTVNAVLRSAGATARQDVSPVSHRPDGTRQCRRCRHWMPPSSFGSGRRGTCRTCRLGHRAQPRLTSSRAAERQGPRVRASALVSVIDSLIAECGSVAVAAERVGLGEDALLGIRRRGADAHETTGLATADRILVAAGHSLDLLPEDALLPGH